MVGADHKNLSFCSFFRRQWEKKTEVKEVEESKEKLV
jgi:hypothetical protein